MGLPDGLDWTRGDCSRLEFTVTAAGPTVNDVAPRLCVFNIGKLQHHSAWLHTVARRSATVRGSTWTSTDGCAAFAVLVSWRRRSGLDRALRQGELEIKDFAALATGGQPEVTGTARAVIGRMAKMSGS